MGALKRVAPTPGRRGTDTLSVRTTTAAKTFAFARSTTRNRKPALPQIRPILPSLSGAPPQLPNQPRLHYAEPGAGVVQWQHVSFPS
jgi:hypothetical protein